MRASRGFRQGTGLRPRSLAMQGSIKGRWVPHDTRDEVVDYVRRWNERTEIPARTFIGWLGITSSKFHDWRRRYGRVNEHNAWIPRDWWLEDWEKQAIVRFSLEYPLEGVNSIAKPRDRYAQPFAGAPHCFATSFARQGVSRREWLQGAGPDVER